MRFRRRLACLLLSIGFAPTSFLLAQTRVQLNPGMSTADLQGAIAIAPFGSEIAFSAGVYNITSQITIPCKDLKLTGPPVTLPTAVLAASFTGSDIFSFAGGCSRLGSIEHLHFENTGAVYFGVGDNSNFAFQHNVVSNLPSGGKNVDSESGLFFDGSLATVLSNILIRDNAFGDPNSCTQAFATGTDEGGYCAGVLISQGQADRIAIERNNFIHLEEGVHINQLATYQPGARNSVCISCRLEYNYIVNYHRIGIEIQVSAPSDSILVEHNAIVDPLNSSYGTFAVSLACCQSGYIIGQDGYSPALIFDDNVLIASKPIGYECPPYGVEFWGLGSQGRNSLIEGTFCNGYTWGYGKAPWAITHNYICGPNYAKGGGYITNQQHQNNPPEQSGNVTGPACVATPSVAPVISPAGGSFTGVQTVSISDTGLNTGVWYTTDGSAPVPGAGTARYYTGPIKIARSATVKAVGMWGAPNQPLSYPPGYGYVPSQIVAETFALAAPSGQTQVH